MWWYCTWLSIIRDEWNDRAWCVLYVLLTGVCRKVAVTEIIRLSTLPNKLLAAFFVDDAVAIVLLFNVVVVAAVGGGGVVE
jgi:hypothetical protein